MKASVNIEFITYFFSTILSYTAKDTIIAVVVRLNNKLLYYKYVLLQKNKLSKLIRYYDKCRALYALFILCLYILTVEVIKIYVS